VAGNQRDERDPGVIAAGYVVTIAGILALAGLWWLIRLAMAR